MGDEMTWGALGEDDRVVYQDDAVILLCGRWQDFDIQRVDAVIADPPYSDKTHAGMKVIAADNMSRGPVGYTSWSEADARANSLALSSICDGWVVIVTDDVLAPVIRRALEVAGRYAFHPLPFVELGKQPRHLGDGPASWCCWIQVGRPREKRFMKWGSLPGAYVRRGNEIRLIKGGKPLWLMRDLVRDYSRRGDVILDPYAGGCTTGRAARMEGRRCILIEQDPETAAKAAELLRKDARQPALFSIEALTGKQKEMFPK